MNSEKAREYFSAYYEETLERGLRQSLEQKLRSDREIKAEYEDFVRTMDELSTLKFEEIPVPIYLNARIYARLEESRAPAAAKKGLVFYLSRFTIAAAAAAAIVATLIAIPRHSDGLGSDLSHAGIVPSANSGVTNWPGEAIQISGTGPKAVLHYSSAKERSVTIYDAEGNQLQSFALNQNQPLTADLTNPENPGASVFQIKVSDNGPEEMVAVPGSKRVTSDDARSGDTVEFALAIADRYGVPVVIDARNQKLQISWSFKGLDAKDAAEHALEGAPLQVVESTTGTLTLKDR